RAVETEVARREDLLARVPADIVDSAPTPAVHRPAVVTADIHPWEGGEAARAGHRRSGVVEDRRDAVAGTVREGEIRRIHMVPEDAVSGEFVQHDAPVPRDADRIGDVGRVSQRELTEANAVAHRISGALGIDGISHAA